MDTPKWFLVGASGYSWSDSDCDVKPLARHVADLWRRAATDEALAALDAAQYEFFCAAIDGIEGEDLLAVARRLAAAIRAESECHQDE